MPAERAASRILLSGPDVGSAERTALLNAFDSGWIAPVGPDLDRFEIELADYVGAEAVLAVSSGTAALHLGLLAVGVQPGDRVLVASTTFAASAFAVVHCGAEPVFCDVDPKGWTIDPDLVDEALQDQSAGPPITAVMAVDLYGVCADYATLTAVCRRHGVALIADAAESLGSATTDGMAGTHGDVAAFSFNGNKIVTTSGGGAVAGSPALVERCRYLATQARSNVAHFEHEEIGYNYRLSNLLAALGRAQLATLDQRIDRRCQVGEWYRDRLGECGMEWQVSPHTTRHNNWLQVALLPRGFDPATVCGVLAKSGIEARRSWKPMHSQPAFQAHTMIGGSVSDKVYHRGICLPSGSNLSEDMIDHICAELKRAMAGSPS